tara:strand:- start:2631 stop:4523 length:1893 start_codon:yes stop_codon:yes gene_type:complete
MALTSLKFKPGITTEVTPYTNEGGWISSDKIRFRFGYPEKIGGWEKASPSTIQGTARALHNWTALNSDNFLGIGTHLKYYIEEGQAFYDITPLRLTTSAGATTFSASNGSSTVTITHSNHGAVENDFVVFSSAASLGGNVTATILNAEHQVTRVVDSNSYEIVVSVTANSSDSGNGGSSTVAKYQINTGLNTQVGGTGWGASTWGRGTWGSAADIGTTLSLRLWSHDNFGEDLLINPRDSGIFLWDKSSGTGTRAVELSTTGSGQTSVPQIAKQILVSDKDRHVLAFGCDGFGASSSATQGDGVQDPLLIRFSNQENAVEWYPTATNTAGDLRIGSGSTFITAKETKREILVWTDTSLSSLQFIGAPLTFGITQLSGAITIMSPGAVAATEDVVYWMGKENFYVYAGQTQQLPCNVKDTVFKNFDFSQQDKVVSGVNSGFSEVWWFYVSDDNSEANEGTGEIDKYVVYNYQEKVWYFGSLSRTAWLDRGVRNFPIAVGGAYIYNHEIGFDDDGSAMTSFIESGPIDIGDGDKFVSVRRILPDLTFTGSTDLSSPQATFTVKSKNFPGADFNESPSGDAIRTASTPVETYTNQLHVRTRGRSFAVRVESSSLGTRWRLGTPRIDIRPDGRR